LKGIWIFQDELQKSHRREYFDKSRGYITRQERDAEIAENRASRRHHPYGRQQQQQLPHMQQHQLHIQDSFPLQAGLRIRIHFIRIRIQHFRLNIDPDQDSIRIWIQFGSMALKIEGKKLQLKKLKNTFYLSLGLRKERPSYRRCVQISKEAIQHFKT
jgi:hypothetical protein